MGLYYHCLQYSPVHGMLAVPAIIAVLTVLLVIALAAHRRLARR